MMPQRRQILAPQGLDIQPMQPAAPMQFAAPPAEGQGDGALGGLMQLAQQYRAGQDANRTAQATRVQSAETDAPMQRRKPPFADIANAAQMAYA